VLRSIHIVLLAAVLTFVTPSALAAGEMGYDTYVPPSDKNAQTYGATIGKKVGAGFSNIGLGFLEIPKNIINTNNEGGFALAVTLGTVKGLIHMCGRAMIGVTDLLTFPVPTEPMTTPQFVWEKFNVETRYNPAFKMQPLK